MAMKDGGPAFPRPFPADAEIRPSEALDYIARHEGMSLRQWYAGLASIGAMTTLAEHGSDTDAARAVAETAFLVADAMIAHEEKP